MSNLDKYSRRGAEAAGALRSAPMSVRLAVVFGGVLQPIGWIVFGFGMIFFWVFAGNADVASIVQFRGKLLTVQGVVTNATATLFSEGGSDDTPGTPVYQLDYEYTDGSGNVRSGQCYTVGLAYNAGAPAPVEYVAENPTLSRIVGSRKKPFGWGVMFVIIFPLMGLALAVGGLWRGLKRGALLTSGKLAYGKLTSKTPTNTKINNQTVYKLTFTFTAEDGNVYQSVCKTHVPARLEDEAEERILYHPGNPARSYPVDSLPAGITLNESDGFAPAPAGRLAWAVLPPLVAIGGHGLYAVLAYAG
jgi:hypothetical protein